MSGAKFISRVMKIRDDEAARQFFVTEVAYIRTNHPEVKDAESLLRSNIGYCFGAGMEIPQRRMWRDVCGAEHPGLGPEFTEREFTDEETFQAGLRWGQQFIHDKYPTVWARILEDRFGD